MARPPGTLTYPHLRSFIDGCPTHVRVDLKSAMRRVIDSSVDREGVRGRVRSARGRRAETTRIALEGNEVVTRCTCRPGSRRPCDHAVALAIRSLEMFPTQGVLRPAQRGPRLGKPSANPAARMTPAPAPQARPLASDREGLPSNLPGWVRNAAADQLERVKITGAGAGGVQATMSTGGKPIDVHLRPGDGAWAPICSCLAPAGEWCVHAVASALAHTAAPVSGSRTSTAPAVREPRIERMMRSGEAPHGPTYIVRFEDGGRLRVELRTAAGEELLPSVWMEGVRTGLGDAAALDAGLFAPGASGEMAPVDLQALASLMAMGELLDEGAIRVPLEAAGGCLGAMAGTGRVSDARGECLVWTSLPAHVELTLGEDEKGFFAQAEVLSSETGVSGRAVFGIPAWAVIGEQVHPIAPAAARLALAAREPLRLSDDDAGRFLFGEPALPPSIVVHGPRGQRRPAALAPRPVLLLRADRDGISGSLRLDYDGVPAQPRVEMREGGEKGADAGARWQAHPGWVVLRQEPENYWIPRDTAAELRQVQVACGLGLNPDRQASFRVENDDAVDLVTRIAGELRNRGWRVEEQGCIERWRLLETAPELDVAVTQGEDSAWIELALSARIGESPIEIDALRRARRDGRRFAPVGEVGQIDSRDPEITALLDSLDEIDPIPLPVDGKEGSRFRAPRTRLGLLPDFSASRGSRIILDETLEPLAEGLSGRTSLPRIAAGRGLSARLRPYQQHGVSWMAFLAKHGLGGVLADDMGLGKTLQTMALVLHLKERRGPAPCLVVAPASVVLGWRDQSLTLAPGLRVEILSGRNRGELIALAKDHEVDLLVCSFATLRLHAGELSEIGWRLFIVDEAQFVKNDSTETAKRAREIRAESVFALTGTPVENHLGELRAIVDLVLPGFLGTKESFKRRFAEPIAAGSADTGARLQRRLRPFLLRRIKDEVASDLPEKIEVELRLPLPPGHEVAYRQVAEEVKHGLREEMKEKGAARAGVHILAALTRLRQAACHPGLASRDRPFTTLQTAKSLALEEQLPEIVEEGHRAVLFSSFTSYLDRIEDLLRRLEIPFLRLDGSTPTEERGRRIDLFQSDEGPPLFLVSLRAGGTGLNLTRADYVFHLDPWWNPAVENQATDRAHRIGRTEKVIAYKLVAAETIEERVIELQKRKSDLIDRALGDSETFGAELTLEEMAALVFGESDSGG